WDAMMDGSQSLNHCMLGHVLEWFYGYVAGIRQKPESAGWKEVLIAPNPGPLTHCQARLVTPAGTIGSRWRIEGGVFRLETEIPAAVQATAILPSGKSHALRPGVQAVEEPWGGSR
ncbi:MAG: hypothetical protein KJZ87_26360, partial [Thermoguttaceae bacterium]|nr:hypothetical protein [Thermoguttaceae bacterium]